MAHPNCDTKIVGNTYVRLMTFRKGDKNTPHYHTYDHMTFLSSGSINRYQGEGKPVVVLKAPQLFLTPKGEPHWFEAREDNTVIACIHVLRDKDGNALPESITNGREFVQYLTQHIDSQTTTISIDTVTSKD